MYRECPGRTIRRFMHAICRLLSVWRLFRYITKRRSSIPVLPAVLWRQWSCLQSLLQRLLLPPFRLLLPSRPLPQFHPLPPFRLL
jgi:hypothetical protein